MKTTRTLASVQLSAITDEKGDLKASRESLSSHGLNMQHESSQTDDILHQPLYIPVNIYEPSVTQGNDLPLGVLERIGLLTVRMLGVGSMTLWLPLLVVLALLDVILVIARW